MRPLHTLLFVFYTIIFLAIGTLLVAISVELITLDEIKIVYDMHNLRTTTGLIGAVCILIGLLITHFTFGSIQRERTIAFNTPDGQVVISLSAIENFIKKLSAQMPEIKDMRSSVVANKKGVNISTRVALWSDVNIPDITEKIQSVIKNKVQDMLGIEEPITTKVHVAKIAHRDKQKHDKSPSDNQQVPYDNF